MAKNNNNDKIFDTTKKMDYVKFVNEHVNKKGRIKDDDKHAKVLKGLCTHHIINKKGKIKPSITNDNNGNCRCSICGQVFPAKLFEQNELAEVVNKMIAVNNQSKFMAVATGADKESVSYFCDTGAKLSSYKKNYKRLSKIVNKQAEARNKKNKNKTRNGSETYGSWNTNR